VVAHVEPEREEDVVPDEHLGPILRNRFGRNLRLKSNLVKYKLAIYGIKTLQLRVLSPKHLRSVNLLFGLEIS
jgi:hypothetical protein